MSHTEVVNEIASEINRSGLVGQEAEEAILYYECLLSRCKEDEC